MSYFRIIIPVYNAENYIEKCIESIEKQTFKDFRVIAVNDLCTDNTFNILQEISKKYNNITCLDSTKKLFNGGARNVGINYNWDSEYTLFLDNDDWFDDENCLQSIYDTIQANKDVDCVRLSYKCIVGNNECVVTLTDNNPKDLTNSVYVAPWTKCIKSDLVTLFPENTLVEDVVQHISQCDNIETVAVCTKPIVCWNRNNTNAASLKENQATLLNGKRISSIYRNVADLMDLKCVHPYCEEHRKWRINCYKNLIRDGIEETF